MEAKDTMLLEKCEESIIDQGGFIFFARYRGQIVGCFSLIRINNTTYELGKMAVEPKFQGMKIGHRLLQFALDLAKEKGWKKLVLYSSTKLPTALHLYKKYGFEEVVLENDLPYARSDIKMELELNN